jgi:hypothetical protein
MADFDQGQTPTIACVNKAQSSLGVDFVRMINALQVAVNQYLYPVWGVSAHLIVSADLIPNAWGLVFLEDPTVAGALGYHDYTPEGFPMSHVFVKTTLESGGSIAETASHEIFEMLINPGIQVGCLGPDGRTWYAREVCDACQNLHWYMPEYPDIPISDFVYPAYFEGFRAPHSTKFDYMGRVSKPFEILPGGYMPINRNGEWNQIFGSKAAEKAFAEEVHCRTPRLLKDRAIWRVSELKTMENDMSEKIPVMASALPQVPVFAATDVHVTQAAAMGFNWHYLESAFKIFGPVVLDVAKELLEEGFTVSVVADVLSKVAPAVYDYLEEIKKGGEEGAKLWANTLIPGMPSAVSSTVLTFLVKTVILRAIRKVLPVELQPLLDQYEDQIVSFVVGLLIKAGV